MGIHVDSACMTWATSAMHRGIAATYGVVAEPLSAGIPYGDQVISALSQGYDWAEAAYGSLRLLEHKWPADVATGIPARGQEFAAEGAAGVQAAQPGAAVPQVASSVPPSVQSGAVAGFKSLLRALPKLVLPGLVALVIFVAGCKLLRLRELDEMFAFAKERLKGKGRKPTGPPAGVEI
jgi:hypothetical protein